MTDRIVVRRYGDAFVSYARDTIGLEKCLEDLKNLENIIRQHPEFKELLQSQGIAYGEKCEFIDNVLQQDFSEEIKFFLKLLIEKSRINEISAIAEYVRVTYSAVEKTGALLRTAFPLGPEVVKEIKDRLEKRFNREFKLDINLDASLLAGVQIIVGNKIIDGSIRKRLDEIKEKLVSVRIG